MSFDKSKVLIYPFNMNSRSSLELVKGLGIRRILREGSKFKGHKDFKIINWGCSEVPDEIKLCDIINKPGSVNRACNKLEFFNFITRNKTKEARVPPYTTFLEKAIEWAKEGREVVARTKLRSRAGSDIVFFNDNTEDFISAPLYTLYIKKQSEWRVHFAFGKQIDIQKKVLRKTDLNGNPIDPKTVDFRIRNHRNGFIFQRHDIEAPEDVVVQATKAFKASLLDFGAVDVIYNDSTGKAYVLEINTAPGLEGQTVESYCEAFRANL